jgi:HK97 family phage portal protein
MLNRFLKIFERKSDAYAALLGFGLATAAKIAVTPETALRSPSVQAAVRVRRETLGSLPLHLYKSGENKARATDHPLYRLLHDRPNAWTSAAEFVMQIEEDSMLHDHGGFALANRSGGKIVELIRLPPHSMQYRIDPMTLEPIYDLTLANGSKQNYPWQDILHIPNIGNRAPITLAREAIGLAIAMERHAGSLFGNGGRPSGVLKIKGRLNKDAHDRIRNAWNAQHSGESAGGTAILEDGAEFDPITFNSVDLQFQELRAFQVVEISRATGVPPTLLSELGRATWANAEEMSQTFLSFTLLPRTKLWQGAVSRLLSADEQKQFYPEFLVDELVKADIAARYAAYSVAIASRIYNPNEVRAMENKPPYAGGEEYANPHVTPSQAPDPASLVRPKPRAVSA